MKYNRFNMVGSGTVIALILGGTASAQNLQSTSTPPTDQSLAPVATPAPVENSSKAALPGDISNSSPVATVNTVDALPPTPPGILPANTEIAFVVDEALSSKSVTAGTVIGITVSSDVKLGEAVAIPRGSKGKAEVTEVRKRGGFSKAGVLALKITSVALPDGQVIDLDDVIVQQGKRTILGTRNGINNGIDAIIGTGRVLGGLGGVGIASAGLVAVGFLIKGDHATVGTETALLARLKANTPINSLIPSATGEAANVSKVENDTLNAAATSATDVLPVTANQ